MELIDRLIASVPPCPVCDLIVGCFTTLVDAAGVGIASTLKPAPHSGIGLPEAGTWVGRDITELAELAQSDNPLAASLGFAAINSSVNHRGLPLKTGNARELLVEKGAGKRLGMIGHFPFVDRIRDRFSETLVFELEPGEDDLPASRIPERLREADIVALTATSLINHTFMSVMEAVRPDATVIMLGPSTPLAPVLFEYGVDALCGSIVTDRDRAFRGVAQASPFRNLSGIEHVNLLKEEMQ